MHCQDRQQLVHRLIGWRERFQLARLLAVQGMVARLGLELHQSRWLKGTVGRLTSMAGTRPLQELKEIVRVADLDLNIVDEPLWALVDRSMLGKKAG